jgi:hypothetical protein
MENIEQIKVDISNKREEIINLHGKTARWGNIHGSKAFYLQNSTNYIS